MTFAPARSRDVEMCAAEPNGDVILWSADGNAVRIPASRKLAVVILLLEGGRN